MKFSLPRRWLVLGGLLSATLAAAAWMRDSAQAPAPERVAAAKFAAGPALAQPPGAPAGEAELIHLEKLKSRDLGKTKRDPFATGKPRAPKAPKAASGPGGAAPSAMAPAPSAPPLPFTYMGKLISEGDLAVFLVQGERNLIVHEGDTIDALYRVERIAEGDITLLFLPLNERQTIIIGEPQ